MLKFKTFLIPITKPKIKTDADTHPTVFFKNSETLKKKKNLNWSTSQSNSKIFSKSKNSLSLQCFNKALKMWRWAMYMVYTVGFLKINLWTANFFSFCSWFGLGSEYLDLIPTAMLLDTFSLFWPISVSLTQSPAELHDMCVRI